MEKTKIGIGTKETEKLKAMPVKILGATVEMQKSGIKDVGEKVVFSCKHPEKDEPIKISATKYEVNKKLKTSGTWFKLDEDEKIVKNSALAMFMVRLGAETLDDMLGKEVETIIDDRGYLAFKSY